LPILIILLFFSHLTNTAAFQRHRTIHFLAKSSNNVPHPILTDKSSHSPILSYDLPCAATYKKYFSKLHLPLLDILRMFHVKLQTGFFNKYSLFIHNIVEIFLLCSSCPTSQNRSFSCNMPFFCFFHNCVASPPFIFLSRYLIKKMYLRRHYDVLDTLIQTGVPYHYRLSVQTSFRSNISLTTS